MVHYVCNDSLYIIINMTYELTQILIDLTYPMVHYVCSDSLYITINMTCALLTWPTIFPQSNPRHTTLTNPWDCALQE